MFSHAGNLASFCIYRYFLLQVFLKTHGRNNTSLAFLCSIEKEKWYEMVMAIEGIHLNVENKLHILFCPSSVFIKVAWKFPLVSNSCCSDQQSCKLFDSFKSPKVLFKFCSSQLLKTLIDNFEYKWKKLRNFMTVHWE